MILSPSIWRRAGHGHSFGFLASDEELQKWLLDSLPSEPGPYSVLATDSMIEGKQVRFLEPVVFSLDRLIPNLHPSGKWRANFWIRSEKLTPLIDELVRGDLDAQSSINGLILLQHEGLNRKGQHLGINLSHVGKVFSETTGETIEHEAYSTIYRKLRRRIKKEIVYSAFVTYPDGTVLEEKNMMSHGAFLEVTSGIPYNVKPGRPSR